MAAGWELRCRERLKTIDFEAFLYGIPYDLGENGPERSQFFMVFLLKMLIRPP